MYIESLGRTQMPINDVIVSDECVCIVLDYYGLNPEIQFKLTTDTIFEDEKVCVIIIPISQAGDVNFSAGEFWSDENQIFPWTFDNIIKRYVHSELENTQGITFDLAERINIMAAITEKLLMVK